MRLSLDSATWAGVPWRTPRAEDESAPKLEEATARLHEIYDELATLEQRDILHGFVWFLRRLPPSAGSQG